MNLSIEIMWCEGHGEKKYWNRMCGDENNMRPYQHKNIRILIAPEETRERTERKEPKKVKSIIDKKKGWRMRKSKKKKILK